jgi:hypothetical protein
MEIELEGAFPWLKGQIWKCRVCKKIVPSENCHGHIDGVVTDLLGVDRLYEHKAINHFSFNRIWAGAWPMDYIAQCAIYIKGIRTLNPAINECLLLIKNKNTSQYIELLMRYDPLADSMTIFKVLRSDKQEYQPIIVIEKIVETAIKKFQQVEEYRRQYQKDETLPARPFMEPEEYPCSYCRFKEICWEGFEQEFNSFKETAVLDETCVQMAEQYHDLSKAEGEIKKQKDQLKEKLKQNLHTNSIKTGMAGIYTISLTLQKRQDINEDLIPPAILQEARVEKMSEVLRISMKKPTSLVGKPASHSPLSVIPQSGTGKADKPAISPAVPQDKTGQTGHQSLEKEKGDQKL